MLVNIGFSAAISARLWSELFLAIIHCPGLAPLQQSTQFLDHGQSRLSAAAIPAIKHYRRLPTDPQQWRNSFEWQQPALVWLDKFGAIAED